MIAIISCKKDITPIIPGGGSEGYINFVNASEALLQQGNAGVRLTDDNMVFINDSVSRYPFLHFPRFTPDAPGISFVRQFPQDVVSADWRSFVPDNIGGYFSYDPIYWMPIKEGNYKYIFTGAKKVFVKDTTVTVKPKETSVYYLVEGPESENAYRIIAMRVTGPASPGKTNVLFSNISPDLPSIDVWKSDANGQIVHNVALPKDLRYGKYEQTVLDTTGAAASNGNIYFKIRIHGNNNNLLTVSLPAVSQSSFLVIIQGFNAATTRKIKQTNNTETSIPILPNLRATLRRAY